MGFVVPSEGALAMKRSERPEILDYLEMVDLKEFAIRMGVCPNTVRNWIATCKLVEGEHFFHTGRIYRFPWGPEFVSRLMQSLALERPSVRPRMRGRQGNKGRLQLRP